MDERKYVIVNNEHTRWPNDALLFWGHRTEDGEKRSFGGYTTRIDQCEMYTRQELEDWRKDAKEHYPFFDELKINNSRQFRRKEDVLCTLEELKSINFAVWNVVCET